MASGKRKERTLNELYAVTTRVIAVPEISPVLSGRYQMQGPVDKTDCDIGANTVLSPDGKRSNKHCKSKNVLMRAESGTCNMCSAPCSSCLHSNRAFTGSKAHDYSDESSEGNAGSQYSVNDVVPVKITACRSGQNTASEISNLLSVDSNQDSFSENAESKDRLRNCDISCPLEDVERLRNLSSGVTTRDDQPLSKPPYNYDKRTLTKMLDDKEVIEGHGESISCVSRVNDAKFLSSHGNSGVIRGYVPHSSGPADLSSHAIDLIEIPSVGDMSEGVSLLKVQTLSSCPSGRKSHSCNQNVMDLKAETDKGSGGLPFVNSPEQIEEIKVVSQSRGLPALQENSLPTDDSDGSDIEEHDVKVCDICGDAGREDLLAICTRCSDGAEHTYCMRETMDKVPEGDWYCEECKLDEETKDLKHDTIVLADGNNKSQSSGQTSPLDTDLFVMLDKKDSYVEGNKQNKDILVEKSSCKRHAENTEVVSSVEKQALETTLGLPKAPGPSRISALSPDLSFRSLDKDKVKETHQLSSGATSDASKAAFSSKGPQLQTSGGTLLKSNSFHSTNATPKVKLDDGVVLPKQKSCREFSSTDMEGPVRLIGKSKSFNKSVNPGRLNPSESKVKMLSPKFSHGQDLKGSKQAKDWNLLERKNSFRMERSLVGSVMGNSTVSALRGDKKIASRGESYSLPSVNSNHESMGVQSDRKLSTLSRSTSNVTHRGSEMPVPSGEIKGHSLSHGMVGPSSTNGISSVYDPLSSTFTSERPFCNANECLPDVLRLPEESTNLGERTRESSINHSRTSIVAGGKSAPSQKSKEIGSCNVENARPLLGGASASRSLKEVVDEGNKLKAAIEAALLKKPGICRKSKLPGPADQLSMSNSSLNSGIRPEDKLRTSINPRDKFSGDEIHEVQPLLQNSTAESCEHTNVNNMKHLYALPSATLKIGDLNLVEPSDRKRFIRDLPSTDTTAISVLLKMSVIPEHEYIWQGGFEVEKIGKCPELHDGIQAHLSTFASPKVPEVVKKFPQKILLNEVPRLSTWPLQFRETGVEEDNIALYFFARDLDSYEKSYKSLLETMMRNDLALVGNLDGVELLIFPSNHLPEKSKRWNTLYFLWGVFRGKKAQCFQDASSSPKKYCNPRDQTTTEGCHTNASSLDQKDHCTQTNAGQKDYRLDVPSLPRIQSGNAVSFLETRCTSTPREDKFKPQRSDQQIPVSSSEIQGRRNMGKNQAKSDTTFVEEEGGSLDTKSVQQINQTISVQEHDTSHFNKGKRFHEDSLRNDVNNELLDGGFASKKQKTDSSDRISEPNLELALGADMKQSKQFPVGKVNLQDEAATQEEEDTASLSLSLAFPILNKVKQPVKPASKSDLLLPDRQHVNMPLLLFDGLSKK